jgi:hypothetical protein
MRPPPPPKRPASMAGLRKANGSLIGQMIATNDLGDLPFVVVGLVVIVVEQRAGRLCPVALVVPRRPGGQLVDLAPHRSAPPGHRHNAERNCGRCRDVFDRYHLVQPRIDKVFRRQDRLARCESAAEASTVAASHATRPGAASRFTSAKCRNGFSRHGSNYGRSGGVRR